MTTDYSDHSPLPWVVDGNRDGFMGMVALFDADGRLMMSFGDMENCDWRDICDAHTVARAANAHAALVAACKAAFEDTPCHYDHHGYCQAHALQPKGECYMELIRAALALAEAHDA